MLSEAGIGGLFERLLSVGDAGRCKPARAAYEYAAASCGAPLGRMLLVAAYP